MTPEAVAPSDQAVDVPTLERPLYLLTFFTPKQPHWTLSHLARASGLPKASCLRALRVLEKYDLLQRDGDRYRLGRGFIAMKAHVQVHAPPLNVARPHLEHLQERTGQVVSWAVLDEMQTLYAEVLGARAPLPPGERRALPGDPSGRLLLAFAGRALRERVFLAVAARPGPEQDALNTLDSVCRRAWFSAPLPHDGLGGAVQVAAPVFRAGGSLVAALGLTWAAGPLTGTTETALRALADAAQTISRELGYTRPWAADPAFFLQVLRRVGALAEPG
ncbi:IclR family transcriptional regulator [Deinococcus aquaedulcis]|uniref:IclR family transcriptional regulator n=1 Tax=Deinococcus aquaedulcis TaxID=2840455 RepID=UPI001C82A731|nr:helix-turn-helix domain-containing protein [Deinococcus aquaedulcis]